ncbi:aminotransferase class I/II-fold pyridoxal phosphate-dependent enzyme [Streptomyces sp. TRM76323]|uniref:8-amino-7-oxononanoate synthase n=1 Tax=Streptomyces tamarix TaxID=3078565 RepID=A0ABU3QJ70_9ACTN|nr:aminotransferase class I/II-fold pyridoxal phosphate-dependent enzyme [Streptomyces tamarix]MDT9682812.1 aminotransferase class I/II-fold pyridoxal phosphate-dependent enzyme [Streptomyces tamarix]
MTNTSEPREDMPHLSRRVLDVIASHTLYDRSRLTPDSTLEGDLGIDSVMREEILASVKERLNLPSDLPSDLSTIQEVLDAAADAAQGAPDAAVDPAPAPGAPPDRPGSLHEAVVDTILRHTHYRRHQLDLDADFESELGLDSVTLASVVEEVSASFRLPDTATSAVTTRTMRELVAALDACRTGAPASPAPAGTRQETAGDGRDDRSMKDFREKRDPDLFAKARDFGAHLRERRKEQLYWYGMPAHSRSGSRTVIFDELAGRKREFLMFASNNYLGLATHPRVVDAICDATRAYGATHTGSRIIGGTHHLHKELERRLAAFKQRPACIVYPGGYSANLGAISALAKHYDAVVIDKLNHMSIADGCKLSGAVRRIYQHNDMADLERVLERCAEEAAGKLIVTDGVFSMHGDICDLPGILALARKYGARILLDDAHATGVLGSRGAGTAEHFGLKGQVDLELGTMSKALAGMGGFVVGEEDVVEYLRFYSNSYVFAANIPAGVAAGLIASLDVIESEPERIERLWLNIHTLRAGLLDAGFDLENSESAILPIVIGDERRALEMGRAVRARGLFCQTVVFPGVPLGDARLRISVTSEHTQEDLAEAVGIFTEAGRETGVLPPAA